MNGKEAKKAFISYANSQFENWGFQLKKTRNNNIIYLKIKENGYERTGISTTNYYPEVVFESSEVKRIDLVEEILWEIDQQYNLNLNLKTDEWTIAYHGNRGKRKLQFLEVENKDNEQGVKESTEILMNYIENEVLPAYDLFDDLRELDKRINGEGENFWEDAIGISKPFNLGEHFFERRLIIARLCNNQSFDLIANNAFVYIENSMLKHTGKPYHYSRKDLSMRLPATIKYLRENINPIY